MTTTLQILLLVGVALALLGLLGVILYWQFIVAEGAYLGKRVVVLLYDRFAFRYDEVKEFNPLSDAILLAGPIVRHAPAGRVLDIATGTGRLPCALFAQPGFSGYVSALDASAGMLVVAKHKLSAYSNRIDWHHRSAVPLPFAAEQFDAVACLEALEFLPNGDVALREMWRVLRPGGLLLVSNRIGPDAWKLPGRAPPTPVFLERLHACGFTAAEAEDWLVDYDLVRAKKP